MDGREREEEGKEGEVLKPQLFLSHVDEDDAVSKRKTGLPFLNWTGDNESSQFLRLG